MESSTFAISVWLLMKGIALCFAIAFTSLLVQVRGLYGRNGILPIHSFVRALSSQGLQRKFLNVPTLFWFRSDDRMIILVGLTGLFCAVAALVGFAAPFMIFIAWICYLSFVSVGQEFLSFQWDMLLLEAGFLAIFLPSPIARWLFLFLLFKLMFLSGVVKLRSGDPTWKTFTALDFHYWTQPLPNPLAYFVEKLPGPIHRATCVITFFIELIIPFFVFLPGLPQTTAAVLFIALQIAIAATGNYAFFNLLSAVLCLPLIADHVWKELFPSLFAADFSPLITTAFPDSFAGAVALILIPLNVFWILFTFFEGARWLNLCFEFVRLIYPLRLSSSYGLFAVMTTHRPEIILQGSNDQITWHDYELKYKPGRTSRMPTWVAPHQPRLDWQLWFAALGSFEHNLWLYHWVARVFAGTKEVESFFAQNPFAQPPKYLRLVRYEYRMTNLRTLLKNKKWWEHSEGSLYSPIFERELFGFHDAMG